MTGLTIGAHEAPRQGRAFGADQGSHAGAENTLQAYENGQRQELNIARSVGFPFPSVVLRALIDLRGRGLQTMGEV